jgi:hypothetical protein
MQKMIVTYKDSHEMLLLLWMNIIS